MIHAWCVRPFITCLDSVEAATPEEAIAIARQHPDKLLDAAEECNGQYPWDEFVAYDERGRELRRVFDLEARVREAAPVMRETLGYVAQVLADFKPDCLRQLGLDAALEQVGKALASADNTIAEAAAATAEDDQA
jgi:hypothetical protein